MVFTIISLLTPSLLKTYSSMREHDLDTVMECVPVIVSTLVALIKILNHNINRKKFENMFDRMAKQWEVSEINGELHVLNEIIEQGSRMGSLYRISLWGFLVLFVSLPLSSPFLDIVAPLNETRAELPLFQLNYIVDTDDHFYIVHLHSAWCSLVVVLIITTIDSLYMVIIHYCCGLFAICGYQVKKATKVGRAIDIKDNRFKSCVITHYEAISFYEDMDESTRTSYLFQVGLNMIGITVTAVQAVMYVDQPRESLRIVMFLLGQQFHLYALSVPGQVMLDRSLELINDIYVSKWHEIPLKFEKTLHIMQIRCSKPCKLSAGGLYEMNIENFGTIFKTCMSYFTILLSLRE
ncbi:odorant receptor 43a-like [Osmia bicornis bicornis]|uniref:odorant receptor 43a-like n=1 Tax=Osmia bicornis bicornis TaxID=1437191 RepID=UPI001EAF3C3B|nr:odorant receptor 43a-like [Osmia bicornis bicornis]